LIDATTSPSMQKVQALEGQRQKAWIAVVLVRQQHCLWWRDTPGAPSWCWWIRNVDWAKKEEEEEAIVKASGHNFFAFSHTGRGVKPRERTWKKVVRPTKRRNSTGENKQGGDKRGQH
jgi:hypothetical protein